MLKYYAFSETLEKLQSYAYYGTYDWTHTYWMVQDQKQPSFPNTK